MPVKLVYDKYSITLRRITTMEATGNINLIKKSWLCPWFVKNRAYKAIMKDVQNIFGDGEESNGLDDMNLWLYMNRKRLIIDGAALACRTEFNSDRCKELYLGATSRELIVGKQTALEYLSHLLWRTVSKMNAQTAHINEAKQQQTTDSGITINQIVEKVSLWVEQPIDREMRLFEFEAKYKEAIEKAKTIQKQED